MSGFTTAQRNAWLQDFIDNGPYYVGLLTQAADTNGAGFTEVDAPEYVRKAIALDVPADGRTANTVEIKFPTPVSTGGYGVIVEVALFDDINPTVGTVALARCLIPGGSFSMPVGYDKQFQAGYITLQLRDYT